MSSISAWQLLRAEKGRYPLNQGTRLILRHMDDAEKFEITGVDVSHRGLGFLTNRMLSAGKVFWLELGGKKLSLEIAHCESYLGIEGVFRCGAFIRDPSVDLHNYFKVQGLLASSEAAT